MSEKPIIDAVHAILSEAELHGSKVGTDAIMFAAALQTLQLPESTAIETFVAARRQMKQYTLKIGRLKRD